MKEGKKIFGLEEDILASYLHNNRSFPLTADFMVLEDGLWGEISNKKQYQEKKQLDKISFWWDSIYRRIYPTSFPVLDRNFRIFW